MKILFSHAGVVPARTWHKPVMRKKRAQKRGIYDNHDCKTMWMYGRPDRESTGREIFYTIL